MPASDKIVYVKVSKAGGIDGRDTSDKGGTVLAASYIESYLQADAWSYIEGRVVDIETTKKIAKIKLTPIERLALLGVSDDGHATIRSV